MKQGTCLICWAKFHGISQELLLTEFGATEIWQQQKRHDEEQHEKPEVAKIE